MVNFPVTNNKVMKHNTGVKTFNAINNMSNGMAAKDIISKEKLMENHSMVDYMTQQTEKDIDNQKASAAIATRQMMESQILYKTNDLYKEGKEVLFKEIIFELFRKSLNLDEEFIVEQFDNLKLVSDDYIDKNGGFKLLETAVRTSKSPMLKGMQSLCESVAKAVTNKKMQQSQQTNTADQLSFDLSEDDTSDFNYEKDKLGMDEMANLVKQKVLTVIQDEKDRQAKEDELITDIEDQLSSDDTVTDKASLQEALNKIKIKQNPIEEVTLFNALLRHSYKELLENVATRDSDANAADDDTINVNASVNTEEDDINGTNSDTLDFQLSNFGEYNLTDELNEVEPDKNASFIDKDEFEIDMDMVLAEALTKYTLIELCHTIQLEKYDAESIKKLSQKLLQ